MNMDAHLPPLRCNKLGEIVLNYAETVSTASIPTIPGTERSWPGAAGIFHGLEERNAAEF